MVLPPAFPVTAGEVARQAARPGLRDAGQGEGGPRAPLPRGGAEGETCGCEGSENLVKPKCWEWPWEGRLGGPMTRVLAALGTVSTSGIPALEVQS